MTTIPTSTPDGLEARISGALEAVQRSSDETALPAPGEFDSHLLDSKPDLEAELKAALQALQDAKNREAAVEFPPFVGHLSKDAGHSVQIGRHIVFPGTNFLIDQDDWAVMSASGRAATLDMLTSPDRQRALYGAHIITEGEGPEPDWPVGTASWYQQRRRRWIAANAISDHDEREAELARLAAHYGSPEQRERDGFHDVRSTVTGYIRGSNEAPLNELPKLGAQR